jgi:hypothetical protein
MYTRQERPLSDADRQELERQLRGLVDELGGTLGMFAVVAALDVALAGMVILSLVAQEQVTLRGGLSWGFAFVLFNQFLIWAVIGLYNGLRDIRQVREALRDGVAVVERVRARAVAGVPGWQFWYLLAIAEDRVLLCEASEVPPHVPLRPVDPKGASHVAACFETIVTRRHRRLLGQVSLGQASLPIPRLLGLRTLFPQYGRRAAVQRRLESGQLRRGSLNDLAGLLQSEPIAAPAELPDPWALLQARLEDAFGLDLGPGGLARLQPRTVGDLVALISQRLPAARETLPAPAAPAFYRLRAALVAQFGVPRSTVRAGTRLETLVPRRDRQRHWRELGQRLGPPLPEFIGQDRPGCTACSWGLGLALYILVGVPLAWVLPSNIELKIGPDTPWTATARACLLGPPVLMALLLAALLLGTRMRRQFAFDARYATVGQLARFLAAAETIPSPAWTEEEVWLLVRRIVAHEEGRRPLEVGWQDSVLSAAT